MQMKKRDKASLYGNKIEKTQLKKNHKSSLSKNRASSRKNEKSDRLQDTIKK